MSDCRNGMLRSLAKFYVVRARCDACVGTIMFVTAAPLEIHKFAEGGAVLRDVHGRVFTCPFCQEPVNGALTTERAAESAN